MRHRQRECQNGGSDAGGKGHAVHCRPEQKSCSQSSFSPWFEATIALGFAGEGCVYCSLAPAKNQGHCSIQILVSLHARPDSRPVGARRGALKHNHPCGLFQIISKEYATHQHSPPHPPDTMQTTALAFVEQQ